MIDPEFGAFGQALRSPDIRLNDVRSELVGLKAGAERIVSVPGRGVFVFARDGEWELRIEGMPDDVQRISAGTAVGFESGRSHAWRAVTGGHLLVSSIPRRMGVLRQLPGGTIVVPPTALPYAAVLRHAVEVHIAELENRDATNDNVVIRRCAEICIIQFIRFAREAMAATQGVPSGLAHDEHLLRAWTAYFAEPQRKWTVKSLAEAAGLGRTAFAQRFRNVFGSPPLQTLTRLRMEQAETLLLQGIAPLIEIAFTVGYNSEAAFVRAFRREFGEPPGKFRATRQTP